MRQTAGKGKAVVKAVIALLLAVAMIAPGAFAFPQTASAEDQDSLTLCLDGMTTEEVAADEELAPLLEDPLFYRYYIVDDDNVIHSMEAVDEDVASESEGITLKGASLASATHPSKYSSSAGYAAIRCIDISNWQGVISVANWKKVKNAGIRRVILRCGFTYQKKTFDMEEDASFEQNIKNAWKAGMIIGVYYYSQATTQDEAKKEANYTIKLIKEHKKKITLPVVYDFEWGGRLNKKYAEQKGKDYMTKVCEAYCDKIKDAGYTPMIYASYSVLTNNLYRKTLANKYKIWLAHYTSKGKATDYPGTFYVWQYTSSGSVSGIEGRVDMNYIYVKGRFIKQKNGEYKLKKDGKYLKKTWVTRAGATYRLDGEGYRLTDCYKTVNNYKYGFDKEGIRYRGVTATINGKERTFLYNGKAVLAVKKTTDKLNARVEPSTKAKIKKVYAKGTKIRVIRYSGDWRQNAEGYWVNSKFLKNY